MHTCAYIYIYIEFLSARFKRWPLSRESRLCDTRQLASLMSHALRSFILKTLACLISLFFLPASFPVVHRTSQLRNGKLYNFNIGLPGSIARWKQLDVGNVNSAAFPPTFYSSPDTVSVRLRRFVILFPRQFLHRAAKDFIRRFSRTAETTPRVFPCPLFVVLPLSTGATGGFERYFDGKNEALRVSMSAV